MMGFPPFYASDTPVILLAPHSDFVTVFCGPLLAIFARETAGYT